MQGQGLYSQGGSNQQQVLMQLMQQQLGYSAPNLGMSNQYNNNLSSYGMPGTTSDFMSLTSPMQASPEPYRPYNGYNRTAGRTAHDNQIRQQAFGMAHNQSMYAASSDPMQSVDRRIDEAAPALYQLGMLSDADKATWDKRNDPGRDANNVANLRKHIGEMLNNTPQLSQMFGGLGNTGNISEGMSNLAHKLISQDQGSLGNTLDYDEKQQNRGVLQRQLSTQMMGQLFREDGSVKGEYGNAEQIGAILNEFSQGGGLNLEKLMDSGKTTIDPNQFKTQVGDNVKKMVDTLDALGDIYGNLDAKGLMQIGGLVTGLDPQDVRHAGRINATVRQTITEASQFGMDRKEYINMIQEGAQTLAGAGYDQQASGMISQNMAAYSGVEREFQLNAELASGSHDGFRGTQRSGFRSMSMQDIHKRNMLNFGGALQDNQLTQASLGLTELLQQQEQMGGILSEDQESKLRNMMTYGPESRDDMLKFASQLQEDTGFNVLTGSGTAEQRMSMFQAEDTDRFQNLMRNTISATNRTVGIKNVLNNSIGRGSFGDITGGPSGQQVFDNLSDTMSNIGGNKTMNLLNQLQDMNSMPVGDERSIAAAKFNADAMNAFSGKSAVLDIDREFKQAGMGTLGEMTNNGTKRSDLTEEQINQVLKTAGFDPETMGDDKRQSVLGEVFSGEGGAFNEKTLIDQRASNKVDSLINTRQSIEASIKAKNPDLTDEEVARKVKGRMASMGTEIAKNSRSAQFMPDDETQAKAQQEQMDIRAFEEQQTMRRENRLEKLDINGADGFFAGVGDGVAMSRESIDDNLRNNNLSRSDLKGARGDIARQIMLERGKHTKKFVESNRDTFLEEDSVFDTLVDGEGEANEDMINRVSKRMGITGSTEEKRAALKKKIAAMRESQEGDGLTETQKIDFDSMAETLVRGDDENSKTFRDSVEGGFGKKVEDDSGLGKARALEETLGNIDDLLRTQSTKVQRVTFAEPLTAKLVSDEGGISLVLNSEME